MCIIYIYIYIMRAARASRGRAAAALLGREPAAVAHMYAYIYI